MSDRPRTRQEIYERIRQTSKEEFILEDMVRLGFWPAQGGAPGDPAEEIRRRGEIERELTELRQQQGRLYNEQALIKELRQKRLAEARRKRQETKERHERERQERAAAWRQRKGQEIVFLGEGVSAGLSAHEVKPERLREYGLPALASPEEIAGAMGIAVGALRFLAFSRRTAPVSHYVRFRVPKKTGGERLISAPMPRLKKAQAWLLQNVLQKVAAHEAAHGFRTGRSIVSNATPHLRQEVVVNIDLKDFFPTVGYRRVKGLFRALGYGESVATVFALLCTEPEVEEVELDGRRFFVALTERHLPQGAPTSPAITNLLCRRLDRRLLQMAAELGFAYTRYADDLSFSAPAAQAGGVGRLQSRLASIVTHEGFVIHPAKTRVLHKGRRQEVTGVVVNERPNVPRDVLRRFRATLYQVEKDGPAGKRWGNAGPGKGDVIASLWGFANYVRMVNPARGEELVRRVRGIMERHCWQPPRHRPPGKGPAGAAAAETHEAPSAQSPSPDKPKKKWWKLW